MTKTEKKGGSQADGTRRSYFVFEPDECIIVGLDTKDGPEHPLFDAESNAHNAEADEADILNVHYYGVLEPILFERDGDKILVVDGRTRVRWARCARKLQIAQGVKGKDLLVVPALPKRGDAAMMWGMSRAANIRRPEDSPIAKAKQAQRLLDMNGNSEEAAAVSFGISVATLRKWLLLLMLDPKVQRAVERGMAVSAAAPLAKLSRSEQVARLAQITTGGEKPTARAVTNKLRERDGKAPSETPAQKLKKIEAELTMYENVLDEVGAPSPEDVAKQLRTVAWEHIERARAILRPPAKEILDAYHKRKAELADKEFGA